MKRTTIEHAFVEYIPETLKEGVVYVSIPFATVVHKCFCGCGHEVVTPLSPTDWNVTFDGKTISLDPSIGSWSLACKSHYWIRRDRVEWAPRWSRREIEAERARDRRAKQNYFQGDQSPSHTEKTSKHEPGNSLWKKIRKWWS